MARKIFEPLEMPEAWQTMVSLALNQPAQSDLSECDWELLRTFTVKNNLALLVHAGAQSNLPTEYRNHPKMIEIRLLSKMQRMQSQSRIRALAQIAEAFQAANLPMLSFKGPILAMELYGDPEMRHSCDLDILVDERNMARACKCLQELGYVRKRSVWEQTPKRRALRRRRDEQMHEIFRRDGVTVELHWRICYRFEVAFEALWKERRRCSLLGQPVDALGASENLCYLVTHGAGHGFRQLRWLLEIEALLKKQDFQISEIYVQMKKRGVASLLLETLLLLYRLPCFETPKTICLRDGAETAVEFRKDGRRTVVEWRADVEKDMIGAQRLVKVAASLLRRNNPEEGFDGRIYKHLLPTRGRRPAFLLRLLEPREVELEWIDLPDRLFFLYYVLRPVHFLMRVGKIKRNPASTCQER